MASSASSTPDNFERFETLVTNVKTIEGFKEKINAPENKDLIEFLRSTDCKTKLEKGSLHKSKHRSPLQVASKHEDIKDELIRALVLDFEYGPIEEFVDLALFKEEQDVSKIMNINNNNNNNNDDGETTTATATTESPSSKPDEIPTLQEIFSSEQSDEKLLRLRNRILERINEPHMGSLLITTSIESRQWFSKTKFLLEVCNADPNIVFKIPVLRHGKTDPDEEGSCEIRVLSAVKSTIQECNPKALGYLLQHPKVKRPTVLEVHKWIKDDYVEVPMILKLMEHFPNLSLMPRTDLLANCIFDKEYQEQSFLAENEEDFDDYPDYLEPDPSILFDELKNDESYKFPSQKKIWESVITNQIFGSSNPTRLGKGPKWVEYAVKCTRDAFQLKEALKQLNVVDQDNEEDKKQETIDFIKLKQRGEPAWCFHRFGCSVVALPEKKYLFCFGEHEDSYDPDFLIDQSIFVFDAKNRSYEMFAYPKSVVPPTDFSSATYVPPEGVVYIIGNFGYPDHRKPDYCQVYKLDLTTMKLERVETNNDDKEKSPGWMSQHAAWLDEQENPTTILLSGGKSEKEGFDADHVYRFCLNTNNFI